MQFCGPGRQDPLVGCPTAQRVARSCSGATAWSSVSRTPCFMTIETCTARAPTLESSANRHFRTTLASTTQIPIDHDAPEGLLGLADCESHSHSDTSATSMKTKTRLDADPLYLQRWPERRGPGAQFLGLSRADESGSIIAAPSDAHRSCAPQLHTMNPARFTAERNRRRRARWHCWRPSDR